MQLILHISANSYWFECCVLEGRVYNVSFLIIHVPYVLSVKMSCQRLLMRRYLKKMYTVCYFNTFNGEPCFSFRIQKNLHRE